MSGISLLSNVTIRLSDIWSGSRFAVKGRQPPSDRAGGQRACLVRFMLNNLLKARFSHRAPRKAGDDAMLTLEINGQRITWPEEFALWMMNYYKTHGIDFTLLGESAATRDK